MVEQLWAPWRLEYVADSTPASTGSDGCVLCAKPQLDDDAAALIVGRGEYCCALLNLYPYNNGHVMVVPYRHVADLTELTEEETAESIALVKRVMEALRATMNPGGFNVGLNLGSAAGAGIAPHLHWHVVPRWHGDVNFMPVLADIKVMPQHLHTTWGLLHAELNSQQPGQSGA